MPKKKSKAEGYMIEALEEAIKVLQVFNVHNLSLKIRLSLLEQEIAELREKINNMEAGWHDDRD
jgi:hypothetical protein